MRRDAEETFQREGMPAAMQGPRALTGLPLENGPPPAVTAPSRPEQAANMRRFLVYDAPAAHRYKLDIDALKAESKRIVPSAGSASQDSFPHHCAEALAHLLGRELVELPGGHSTYAHEPRATAAKLREVLSSVDTVLAEPPDSETIT